ncbi:alpha-L-fucosidase [Anseongella ginsenosidimutans]|nr:alpha-L-fucosidase [Anseongella ginsenosidimutans]
MTVLASCKTTRQETAVNNQEISTEGLVLPSPQQVEWQQMEYYMFIHFGPNTFTDMEWGHGDEDPEVFNPTALDAEQWARVAKQAGMKGIIITAKHHDGFCLWPSKYSTHTVKESGWKDGKGDVLRELSAACKKYGLKMGVYLSPWDRNHPAYGTPEYNQVFVNMLTEVLTGYGDIFEVWFDGANGEGPNGKRQVYDWDLFNGTVHKYQPDALIFSDVGPGCRWIGNENGIAGETNWSTINTEGFEPGTKAPAREVLNQGQAEGRQWVPGEADVSIRPGWFFSPSTNDKVKSLEHLLDIYYSSVGRNANLLLNVPVNREGLIHPNDSARLMELRRNLDDTFDENLAENAKITSESGKTASLKKLTDGDFHTFWTPGKAATSASFTLDLGGVKEFNRLELQEYIAAGQRVKSFSIEIWDEQQQEFRELDRQTTIGYKRLLRFPNVKTSRVRINITDSKPGPVLSGLGLYLGTGF